MASLRSWAEQHLEEVYQARKNYEGKKRLVFSIELNGFELSLLFIY